MNKKHISIKRRKPKLGKTFNKVRICKDCGKQYVYQMAWIKHSKEHV